MTDNVDFGLMFEMIKDTNSKVADMALDLKDVKVRVTLLEQGVANVNSRMDRFESRLDQIDTAISLNQPKQ